jgi:Ser/Thr protein kinase RdoA (MazF antagonist)
VGPPLRSLLAADDIAALVTDAYGLSATGAVLLRSLSNDVYRVDTARGPLVLKLYRHGRPLAGVVWEVRLAAHLGDRVPQGVPLRDGHPAGALDAPEGARAYALWEWAPGAPPQAPATDRLAGLFGRAVASFHAAADVGAPPAPRGTDLGELLGPTLDRVRAAVGPADRELLARFGAALPERLGGAGLDRGICHGDVSLDNVHVDGDRLVLYDLDLAGAGWRAADLTGVATTPTWPAFLAGYREVRPFGGADLAALPWLRVLALISNLHFHLVEKPAIRGIDSIREGWADRDLAALRTGAPELLE